MRFETRQVHLIIEAKCVSKVFSFIVQKNIKEIKYSKAEPPASSSSFTKQVITSGRPSPIFSIEGRPTLEYSLSGNNKDVQPQGFVIFNS
jgi:hypothetical protein